METKDLKRCVDNIMRNLEVPTTVRISEPFRDRSRWDVRTVFLDIMTSSWAPYDLNELKSCTSYRALHVLVKSRLIDALIDQRDLANDTLRRLRKLKPDETT